MAKGKRYFKVTFNLDTEHWPIEFRIEAKDEKDAMVQAMDLLETGSKLDYRYSRNAVVPATRLMDWAMEMADANGWYGSEGEDFAWEVVTEGMEEPAGDGRWINGYSEIEELNSEDEEYRKWLEERGYHTDYGQEVVNDHLDTVYYCSTCRKLVEHPVEVGNDIECRDCYSTVAPITPEGLRNYYRMQWRN